MTTDIDTTQSALSVDQQQACSHLRSIASHYFNEHPDAKDEVGCPAVATLMAKRCPELAGTTLHDQWQSFGCPSLTWQVSPHPEGIQAVQAGSCGDIFPTPGADNTGKVILPPNVSDQATASTKHGGHNR